MVVPDVIKKSRGVHGNAANADWDGAMVTYLSKPVSVGAPIVGTAVILPPQSTKSKFPVLLSLTSRSAFEAATPMGPLPVKASPIERKISGAAVQKIPVTPNNTAVVRVIFVLRLILVFILD